MKPWGGTPEMLVEPLSHGGTCLQPGLVHSRGLGVLVPPLWQPQHGVRIHMPGSALVPPTGSQRLGARRGRRPLKNWCQSSPK